MDYKKPRIGTGLWEQLDIADAKMSYNDDLQSVMEKMLTQQEVERDYVMYTGENGAKAFRDSMSKLLETQMINRIAPITLLDTEYTPGIGVAQLEAVSEFINELEEE